MRRFVMIAMAAVVVAAGCASTDEGPDAIDAGSLPVNDQTATQPVSDGTPVPVEPGDGIGDGTEGDDLAVVSPELADEIDIALADLADRLGDDRVLGVTVAFELTWPDGSLGCPQPGMMYTQALVDGYLIELTDGTDTYVYHGASGQEPSLCEGESSLGAGGGPPRIPPTTTP